MDAHDMMVMRSSRDVERKQKGKHVVDRQLLPNGLNGYLDENNQGSEQSMKQKRKIKKKTPVLCKNNVEAEFCISDTMTDQFLSRN